MKLLDSTWSPEIKAMTIDEYIAELHKIREEHGNLQLYGPVPSIVRCHDKSLVVYT